MLVQKLALHKIVHIAANDSEINKKTLEAIKIELKFSVFNQLGEATGDVYVERPVQI